MLNYRLFLITFLSIVTLPNFAFAKDIPVQARLFAGSTSADPTTLNETIEAQGLKKIDKISQLGLEITYPLFKYLDVGARYTKRLADSAEQTATANAYTAKIDQDSILLIARVPFLKTDMFRLDAFAGVGGTNTTFKIKTASQDGELTSRAADGWFSSPYAAAGASAAIGYKQFYLVFEGGFEKNKIDNFKTSGTVNSSIDSLDLSGSYFSVGLMFDGIPGSVN